MSATIRFRLILLVLSTLLPALLAGAWALASAYDAERDAQERRLEGVSRALLQVVDSELARRATVAQVLAQSRALDAGAQTDAAALQAFDGETRRVMQGLGGWVELRAPGRVLLDTREPTSQAPASEVPATLATARHVLPLRQDAHNAQDTHTALLQPVQRGGLTTLNLLVTLRASELQDIIDRQQLPARWVATVLDDRGVVVARHPAGPSHVGRSATPDMLARLRNGQNGLSESVTLDGMRSTAFNLTGAKGWSVVTAMPREQFAGMLPRNVMQIGLVGLVLLALALAGALWLARRIALPVQALTLAATSLKNGEAVSARVTGIVECDEVAQALAGASQTLLHNRAELERQVAAAVARTRQAEQRISRSQRTEALGRLTGGVAHDFNNLLGVISNSAYLIQKQADGRPELELPVAATQRAVEVGSRLTQHLLRVAGERPVRPLQVVLSRFLPEAEDLLRCVLGRQVVVVVQVAPDTCPVLVDPSELELALINVALNARDAMSGRGELRLRAGHPDTSSLADWAEVAPALDVAGGGEAATGQTPHGWVEIAISDTGSGMDSELAATVFEPFFTTKPTGKGTGLGLSQVQGFCVQAGGAARIDSTPGVGTTVRMLLPAQSSASMPGHCGPDTDDAAASATDPGIAGAKLLLVEDNTELAEVTAQLLRSHGAEVAHAPDAAQALKLLDRRGPVDLVLSDIVMPGPMDGLALARQLRREQPQLPVILISAYAADGDSVNDFPVLRKPCSQADLLAALQRALASRQPGTAGNGGA